MKERRKNSFKTKAQKATVSYRLPYYPDVLATIEQLYVSHHTVYVQVGQPRYSSYTIKSRTGKASHYRTLPVTK